MGEMVLRRAIRDSVFCDLFSQEDYLLELYQALHPEDEGATADDLEVVTLDRVVANGEYNDLGLVARGRLMILVEAQTEWSANIVTRMLFYLAETYRRYVSERGRSLHGRSAVRLPAPELYVVYTGQRDVPPAVTFTRETLGGAASALELTVRVLRRDAPGVVGEYVAFAGIVGEVRADAGVARADKAREVVRRCVERGILKAYMRRRRTEVEDIMFALFDQEEVTRLYHKELAEEAIAEGMAKGMAEGMAKGMAKGMARDVVNLMAALGLSMEEAMDVLDVPADDRARVARLASEQDGSNDLAT